MTPDLMEAGAQRTQALQERQLSGATDSGGRSASYGRVHQAGEVDLTHGRILYLEAFVKSTNTKGCSRKPKTVTLK